MRFKESCNGPALCLSGIFEPAIMILSPILECYRELASQCLPVGEPFGSRETRPDYLFLRTVEMYHDPLRTSSVRILGLHDESFVRARVKISQELTSIGIKELDRTCKEFNLRDVTPCPPLRGRWYWSFHIQRTFLSATVTSKQEDSRMLH